MHKIAFRNSTISIPIKYVCDQYISLSSGKVFFVKEHYIYGSWVKSITISENTSGIRQIYFFSFFSMIEIFDSFFLYFVVTLLAAAFHAQMFLNCSNSS